MIFKKQYDEEELKDHLKNPIFIDIIDKIVGLYMYGAVIGLVAYMLFAFGRSFYFFIESIVFTTPGADINATEHEVLHIVAFTIVLVKAYKVLLEYARTQHVNLKYILEIAIIAPIIEIIFNFSGYEFQHMIFLGVFTITMTFLYLYFYETLKQVNDNHKEEQEEEFEEHFNRLVKRRNKIRSKKRNK